MHTFLAMQFWQGRQWLLKKEKNHPRLHWTVSIFQANLQWSFSKSSVGSILCDTILFSIPCVHISRTCKKGSLCVAVAAVLYVFYYTFSPPFVTFRRAFTLAWEGFIFHLGGAGQDLTWPVPFSAWGEKCLMLLRDSFPFLFPQWKGKGKGTGVGESERKIRLEGFGEREKEEWGRERERVGGKRVNSRGREWERCTECGRDRRKHLVGVYFLTYSLHKHLDNNQLLHIRVKMRQE